MELAAVVEVPAPEDSSALARGGSGAWNSDHFYSTRQRKETPPPFPSWAPVLGNDILGSWLERLRRLGMRSLWATSQLPGDNVLDGTLPGFAKQGAERFLLIRRKSYAEMDLTDLLRFHRDSGNRWTEAHDERGQLGVTLLDRAALYGREGASVSVHSPSFPSRARYQFDGYAKRIFSARGRQELAQDVFRGVCSMRPIGTASENQVWLGENVNVHPVARLIGPAYIGSGTMIGARATIGPYASIEHNCVVDCGTTIERATILPFTYLSPGLLIRDAQVDGGEIEDLKRGTRVDLKPARLTSRLQRRKANRFSTWWAAENLRKRNLVSEFSSTWWEVQI